MSPKRGIHCFATSRTFLRTAHLFLDLRQPKCGSRSNGPRPSGQRARKGTPNRVPKRISLASFMSEFPMPCCGPRVVLSIPCGRRKLYGDVGLGPACRDSAPLGSALGKGGGRDRAKQPRLIRRWINERPHHAPRRLDLYILSTSLRV